MSRNTANYWIERLEMIKHPEGGYFKETYRSDEVMEAQSLPDRYAGNRSFGTSIYFLLSTESHSKFHRLQSDEIWHFHQGGSAAIHIISPEGKLSTRRIGSNLENGESLQVLIPRNSWFASEVVRDEFILVGCTVSPGFEFQDFELAEQDELPSAYPEFDDLIKQFT